jgi:hypothetical protein
MVFKIKNRGASNIRNTCPLSRRQLLRGQGNGDEVWV